MSRYPHRYRLIEPVRWVHRRWGRHHVVQHVLGHDVDEFSVDDEHGWMRTFCGKTIGGASRIELGLSKPRITVRPLDDMPICVDCAARLQRHNERKESA